MYRQGAKVLPIINLQAPVGSTAKLVRFREDCVENRCEIVWRTVDDAQNLGGRRLLLQRFSRLSDQPRVLDRDDRLVSKCLDNFNLSLREALRAFSTQGEDADDLLSSEERNSENRMDTAEGDCLGEEIVRVMGHIGDVNR